ncbi:uncharacterized protein LOC110855080 isoform X2 [Folsomia candida]|uniref:uncharacterized protein LOC110855080 isoform X2 n=1 Tax=Folsomia candida TaxID=158441 RepID=UPI001604FD8A|nr:uncharacterized protein LOC110855080 isoform X2 [Folsomia candida]
MSNGESTIKKNIPKKAHTQSSPSPEYLIFEADDISDYSDNNLSTQSNLSANLGSRGPKSPFSKSWMKHIIYEAIQGLENLGNADDDEVWEAIKNWLKNSNKRIESDRKKLEKSNAALPLRNTGPESDN